MPFNYFTNEINRDVAVLSKLYEIIIVTEMWDLVILTYVYAFIRMCRFVTVWLSQDVT
jgi:hypothetical protein